MDDQNKKLTVVNALRGFAIIGVVWHHMMSESIATSKNPQDWGFIQTIGNALLANGWLGVNAFFVLSGFVLALPYLRGDRTMESTADIRHFYMRRAERILPLYYLSYLVLAAFPIQYDANSSLLEEAFFVLTATNGFTLDHWSPKANWVLWSLSVEIWFSVVFPFLLLGLRRLGCLRFLGLIMLVSLSVRLYGSAPQFDSGNVYLNPVRDSFLGRLDEFYLGILIAYFYTKTKKPKETVLWLYLIGGGLLVLAACLIWDTCAKDSAPRLIPPFINIVLDMGLSGILYSLLALRSDWVRRIICLYPLQLIGLMCYSIYIWHGRLLREFESIPGGSPLMYLLYLFLLSLLSYRYIEFGRVTRIQSLFLIKAPSQRPQTTRSP